MKKKLTAVLAVVAAAGVFACSGSSSSPSGTATYDFTGTWQAMLMPLSSAGDCPAGRPQAGTATISQSGSSFTLSLTAGFDCRPAGACVFQGTVDGVRYTASNAGMADEEGGRYANDLFMDASTEDVAQGFVSSSYTHPKLSCSWESTFVISR